MNYKLSEEVYIQLIKGKYINKHNYDSISDILLDNELYKEILKNLSEYIELYKKIGLDLINENNAFYLMETKKSEEEINPLQFKEYILFLIIIKHLNNKKIEVSGITNYKIGIHKEIIEEIFTKQEYISLLNAADISTIQNPLQKTLIEKNILYFNTKKNYVLSDIGISFLKYIENHGKELSEGKI